MASLLDHRKLNPDGQEPGHCLAHRIGTRDGNNSDGFRVDTGDEYVHSRCRGEEKFSIYIDKSKLHGRGSRAAYVREKLRLFEQVLRKATATNQIT